MSVQSFPSLRGDQTPLRCTAAVAALWDAWGDMHALASALNHVPTWGELVGLTHAERVSLLGPAPAGVTLPAACPATPALPGGARAITAYDADYPGGIDPLRWPVLYVHGHLPRGAMVAIGGAKSPSPQGVEVARSAALAAVADHVPVVAPLLEGLGLAAARTAIAAAGKVVLVVPHGLDLRSAHDGLLDQVRHAGGAVLTAARPGTRASTYEEERAVYLSASLARAVVVAEVGPPPGVDATFVRGALEQERFIIAPASNQQHAPISAVGLTVLTSPRMFTREWYGTSAHVERRASRGLSAADVVVGSPEEIAAAIRQVCAPPPPPPPPSLGGDRDRS